MLCVVYPHMCGLGGDLFLLLHDATTGKLHCLNGSGRAPQLAIREAFAQRDLDAIPVRGPLAVTVPGVVAAWEDALGRFGTRPLGELLLPAIHAADSGYQASERLVSWVAQNAVDVARDDWLRRLFLNESGNPIEPGETIRLPELARSLERIAERGSDVFYHGEIADAIDSTMRSLGGLLRKDDLLAHRSTWVEPVQTRYRGLDVYTTPPNSQGFVALEMLNILTQLGAENLRPGSPERVRAFVHAKRAAFGDRDRWLGDPAFVTVPTDDLLAVAHARSLASTFPPRSTSSPIGGDTVYLCAVDDAGNACSLIQSIYYAFGSCVTVGDTGIVLQNRGHYFSLAKDHPNALAPGRRTAHTLMASMAFRAGRPHLVFGTMGADGQPQTTVQVLDHVLDGAPPQAAVASPRLLHGRFLVEDDAERLLVEANFGKETLDALREAGLKVETVPALDERMGHAHAILVHPDGDVEAGADPRSDGAAMTTLG